jgi:4-amino-4-deoxy-L-arabinose transferase-like glycosyltransferase
LLELVKKTTFAPMRWSQIHWLLLFFGLANLLQAAFTPLTPDEAYYRMYAARLDWGYFDHPPAVAWFIRLGQLLVGDNALGIRLGFVTAQIAALWIALFRLCPPTDREHAPALLLVATIILLHVYGWVATPDGPLLLAAALFLWAYQRWTQHNSMWYTVLLGLSMAAMLWAKYHGVLVILAVIGSNPRLILQPKAWLAVMVGVAAFAPHLAWQAAHNFPTFQYHLGERSPEPYSIRHTLEFIGNQLLLYNPLVLIPVVWAVAKGRFEVSDPLSKAMRVLLFAFPLFFLFTTASVYAEPHWTYIIVLPLIYFLSQMRGLSPRFVRNTLVGVLSLVLLARLVVVWPGPYLPPDLYKTHLQAKAILKAAAGRNLVLGNSYQLAALCDFYGKTAVVGIYMADQKTRHNQYTTLNNDELKWQNQPVFVAATTPFDGGQLMEVPDCKRAEFWVKPIQEFHFLKNVVFTLKKLPNDNAPVDLTKNLQITIENPYDSTLLLDKTHWQAGIYCYNKGYLHSIVPLDITGVIAPQGTLQLELTPPAWPEGWLLQKEPEFVFSLMRGERPHSVNSQFFKPLTTPSHTK